MLISSSEYKMWDNEKKKWKECDSFYSVNKSSLSITICSSSEKVTSNEYTFKDIGEHKVMIKIKENVVNLGGMLCNCNNLIKV